MKNYSAKRPFIPRFTVKPKCAVKANLERETGIVPGPRFYTDWIKKLAQQKKKTKKVSTNRKPAKVTRTFLETLSGRREDTYYRVLDAIALKRRDPKLSLTKAATHTGTTVGTIGKYAPSALQMRSGRFDVKPSDRLLRRMRMLTSQGEVVVRTTSSRTATRIAEYNNALREYALTRDTTQLKRFENKVVRSGGTSYTFVTDPKVLDRNIRAGLVHFVDIYVRGAAI